MSRINSPVKQIEDLQIEPWPDNIVLHPEKVIRRSGVTIMKLQRGHVLYCNSIKKTLFILLEIINSHPV
jgi:hypothetical protein